MSDYYNHLAIDSMREGADPVVECDCCTSQVPLGDIVACEACGHHGCVNCMVEDPVTGYWYCPDDTDCGEARKAGEV